MMIALNLVAIVPLLYTSTYLGVSQEAYGSKLLFGGVVQGMALVLLIWIYFYTESHTEDEKALAAVFHKFATASSASTLSGDDASSEDTPPVSEDSEF